MNGSLFGRTGMAVSLALAAAPLSAAGPDLPKYRCGVQLSLVGPRGDMSSGGRIPDYDDPIDGLIRFDGTPAFTASGGLGLTLFGEVDWTARSACRLKVEYLPFGKKSTCTPRAGA